MAANDPNASLEDYRSLDKTEAVNAQGERIPEKETLNNRFVNEFLNNKGITPENFDKNFTLSTAIELTSYKHSKGEEEMYKILTDAKNFLDQRNLGSLLESMNELTAKSEIHRELDKRVPKETDQEVRIVRAYNIYRSIKMHCDRIFKIREQSSKVREEEKTKIEKGVKEEFAGIIDGAKGNFEKMDGKEKLLLVVGGLIGAAMLMGSESPRVARIKETIWTCCKIGGVAWFGNELVKVFTGKTGLQTISDWSKSNTATESFWTKVYQTDSEKAEALRASTIYLGDKDFDYLAKEYQTARDTGKNSVSIPGVSAKNMDARKIYVALDVFFRKYPVEVLIQKYKKYSPRPKWREVVGSEMIDDKSIEMDDSLISQTVDGVHSTFVRAYNAAAPRVEAAADSVSSGRMAESMARGGEHFGRAAGEIGRGTGRFVKGAGLGIIAGGGGIIHGGYDVLKGTGKAALGGVREVGSDLSEAAKEFKSWVKETYRKNFGEEGTDADLEKFQKEVINNWADQTQSADLEKFIREHTAEKKKADGYVEAMRNGTNEKVENSDIKFVISGDKIYVTSETKVNDVIGHEQAMVEAAKKSDEAARKFLKQKYPQVGDDIDRYVELSFGGWVANEAGYRAFMYMPLPGTTEFNQRKVGQWSKAESEKRKSIETFGDENKFDYEKMEPWDQQILRLRFYLDSTQTKELQAVCDAYNRMYNHHGYSLSVVRSLVFGDNEDAKKEAQKVLEALSNSGELDLKDNKNLKLGAKRGILEAYEDKIATIEKDAKGRIQGNDSTKLAFERKMRQDYGYSVRLALLGDTDAMKFMNYDPKSQDKNVIQKPEKLLDRYEEIIKTAAGNN